MPTSEKEKRNIRLVNPNLGHPLLLDIKNYKEDQKIKFSILIVSNFEKNSEIYKHIEERVSIVPIYEYKWYLDKIIEDKISEKKKERGFFQKIKYFFSKKIKVAEIKLSDEDINDLLKSKFEKLEPIYGRTFFNRDLNALRGNIIPLDILKISDVAISKMNHLSYLNDEYCKPLKYLMKNEVFGKLKNFFKVELEFEIPSQINEYLGIRDFTMFDIVLDCNSQVQINYHSLVLYDKDWNNLSFIQATDLHLAERNDKVYGIIKDWYNLLTPKSSKAKNKSQTEKPSDSKDINLESFESRFNNPNNNYRSFIKVANNLVKENGLDFIVITGDIVDFTLLSKLPKDLREVLDFDYSHSNWKIFKRISLNIPQKHRPGMISSEEILCPMFTIPGNHDYRPFHYDLRWGGIHKKIGLKLEEALVLNDKLLALPISAITKNERALRAYWSEINPSLNYTFRLGNNIFIFLNTGSDSFSNLKDLLTGKPSLTGLFKKQIKYLENIINYKIKKEDNVFLLLHGPPINTSKTMGLFKKIEKTFKKDLKIKIEEFKESVLEKLGKTKENARIDDKFNVKYGTVSQNWNRLVKFCKDYTILTLAGHTHELKEFRLSTPKEKSSVFDAPPFNLRKIENPASVYYDLYSEKYQDSKSIYQYKPFTVQTPALGLGAYNDPELAGAYRKMIIKEGKLRSFGIEFIDSKSKNRLL
jgi:hypothetical protein